MAVCAVPRCSTVGGHKFPRADQVRLEKWLDAVFRDSYPAQLSRHAVVCRKHFLPEDYALPKVSLLKKPKPQLKRDAVPSQFPWTNEDYILKHNKRRQKKEKKRKEEKDLKIELENKGKKVLADAEYIEIEIDMSYAVSDSNFRNQNLPSDAEQRSDSDKFSVNGDPQPLRSEDRISSSPSIKQEPGSDTDSEQEWRHGNLESVKAEADDEWDEAPTDIGSFLHTRLTVDGDNSGEVNEGVPPSTPSTAPIDPPTYKMNPGSMKPSGPKPGLADLRFTDVIKLKDYKGHRLSFWTEDFVQRVMEGIRLKELEMRQAAEILGVSYGMLYNRYRDAYGCINRPRTAGDLGTSKSATDVLEKLRRGDIPMDVAAQALGCSARDLDSEQEWRHGNLESVKAEADDEWDEAPTDIGSFLHTRLTVDGDNSGEVNEGVPPSTPSTAPIDPPTYKMNPGSTVLKPSGPKPGLAYLRFTDVIKLKDYKGHRLSFWTEDFVQRVMEGIRLKELEMRQAAEILGVSYGMLYNRYRDAYGCINRPRTAGDLGTSKSATDVLEKLRRGDIPMDVAAQALGCSARDLYVHYNNILLPQKELPRMPIIIDPCGVMTSPMTPQPMTAAQDIIVII